MRTVINHGLVIDPANQVYSKLNVAIENGKITEFSIFELQGDQVINAEGLVITPGFVDLHMHEDPYIEAEDRFDVDIFNCMLKMGVTTAIGGNCGLGPEKPDVYMDAADRLGLPVNLGLLVPHGSLRSTMKLPDRYGEAPLAKIKEMAKLTEQYLDNGCLGISYGIRYIPGLTALEMELVNKAAYRSQKMVAAHIRDDADRVISAAKEFIQSGIKAKVPMQISHIGSMGAFGHMSKLLSLLDSYHSQGLNLASDCYPYTAFSTTIGSTTFDEGFTTRYGGKYEFIEVAEGQYRGQRLNEALYHQLRKESPEILMIAYVMNETEIDMAITHPNVCVASDGILNNSQGHPRAAGSFPRFIKQYVREKKMISLSEAIAKITYLPAQRIGINKGTLGIGCDADITIFDLAKINDKATFAEPVKAPEGIKYVLIGGQIVCQESKIILNNKGKTIRK